MKQLFFLILILPLLGMTPPNKEARQRKVVEEYVHTLLNTDEEILNIYENEDIQQIFPSFKLSRTYTKEEIDDIKGFLLFVKQTLKGHKYKIVNFKEADEKLKTEGGAVASDRGDVYYIYDKNLKGVFFQAAVVVDDDNKIISIAIGMCLNPKRLCFLYL
nr:hypothetical protein [uncultured Capnocytophaga sp.]